MNKTSILLLILSFFTLIACGSSDEEENTTFYTVSFRTNGGNPTPDNQKVASGKTASAPGTSPTKMDYVFMYWHLEGEATAYSFQTPIYKDIILYAQWQEEAKAEYWGVSWNLNGGKWTAEDNHATKVLKGGTLSEPITPTKEDLTFEGWYKEVELVNKVSFPYDVSSITADFTLYAKWVAPEAKHWEITWELNGGSWPSEGDNHVNKIEKGNKLSEPAAPTKDGNSFEGWYKETALTNKITFPTDVSNDLTLYAKWASNDPSTRGEGLYIGDSMTPIDLSSITKGDNIIRQALMYIYNQGAPNNYILILENDIQMTQMEHDSWFTLNKKDAVLTVIGKGRNITLTGPDKSVIFGVSKGTLILEKNLTLKGKCTAVNAWGEGGTAIIREGCSIQVCGHGAAIDISDKSIVIMEGGTITGNVSPSMNGGGVSVKLNAFFTMKGGSISGNYAGNGGGVSVSNNGTFTMEGGWIGDNHALKKGDSALGVEITSGSGYGGGVYINTGKLKIRGGKIYGVNSTTPNKAKANGDCYYFNRGYLVLKSGSGEWEVYMNNEGEDKTV